MKIKLDRIEITQQLVKSLFDYNDGGLYWKVSRGTNKNGNKAGCRPKNAPNRVVIGIGRRVYFKSRIIFLWHHGYLPEFVDHIDRDTLNDNIENLRAASRSENNRNRASCKNSSSEYLGIFKKGNKWGAQLSIHKKKINIGYFKTEEEAALAYNKAAVEYHKEFANLNIIKHDSYKTPSLCGING